MQEARPRGPAWVTLTHLTTAIAHQLILQLRTRPYAAGTAARCHQQTLAPQKRSGRKGVYSISSSAVRTVTMERPYRTSFARYMSQEICPTNLADLALSRAGIIG